LGSWLRFLGHVPDAGLGLKVGDIVGVGVFLISSTLRLLGCSGRWSGLRRRGSDSRCPWVLETVPDLFLTDRVCYLSGLSKKIKVLAHRGGLEFTTEGIVVERILVIVKLVTEAIVGVLEIDSANTRKASVTAN
jgi:hypothetical protein